VISNSLPLIHIRVFNRRARAWLGLFVGVSLLFLSTSSALMAAGSANEITTPSDFSFGIWTTGTISETNIGCAVAAEDRGGRWALRIYKINVRNLDTGDGFYLYLDGDPNNSGNKRIEVGIEYADLLNGNTFEILSQNRYDSSPHNGQPPGCPDGNNAALRVSISDSELSSKVGGYYVGEFDIWLKEGNTEVPSLGSFEISVTVGGVAQVQISHLDNIAFGQYGRTGNLSADEHFCVYSSNNNGGYRLSVSSNSQDSSGNFYMQGDAFGSVIPLSVSFAATGVGSGTTPVTSNVVSANGDSNSTDCFGSDNATLTLFMAEADLQAAKSDSYTDLLTILVEPE
jgi:hypothetical protein